MPPCVPAKTLLPITARVLIPLLITSVDNPLLTSDQLVPLFDERKMPPPVPAKIVLPFTARQET